MCDGSSLDEFICINVNFSFFYVFLYDIFVLSFFRRHRCLHYFFRTPIPYNVPYLFLYCIIDQTSSFVLRIDTYTGYYLEVLCTSFLAVSTFLFGVYLLILLLIVVTRVFCICCDNWSNRTVNIL